MKYGAQIVILECFVCWIALAVILRFAILRKHSAKFSNAVVSIVHAFVAIYYCILSSAPKISEDIGEPNTEEQTLCLVISLSYFLYDMFYCVIVGDMESVVHHVITVGALASGVLKDKSGTELVSSLLLMEISNPSLHLRAVLRELGYKDSSVVAVLNNLIFALLFLVCRLIIAPPLVYYTVVCKTNDYIVKAGAIGIFAVSLLWAVKIIRISIATSKQLAGGNKKEN